MGCQLFHHHLHQKTEPIISEKSMTEKWNCLTLVFWRTFFWYEITNHAKSVILDEFVVMPNHIHGILVLQNGFPPPDYFEVFDYHSLGDENDGTGHRSRDRACPVSTPTETQYHKILTGQNRFQNPGKNSVSSIIGSYKSSVTKHANRLNLENGWQTRFHDNIIRSKDDYFRIKNYIRNNPKNWEKDRFRKD